MTPVDQDDRNTSTRQVTTDVRTRLPDGVVRRALLMCDAVAVAVAWAVALLLTAAQLSHRPSALLAWSLGASLVTVMVLTRDQVYLARVLAVRALVVQRVGRATVAATALLLLIDMVIGGPLTLRSSLLATLLTCAAVVAGRSAVLARLHAAADVGDTHRSLLLAEDETEGARVLDLLTACPKLGYHLVGFVSTRRPSGPTTVPWVGTPADLPVLTRLTAADSVLVAGDTFAPDELGHVLDALQALDVHTHLITTDTADTPQVRLLPLSHRASARPADRSLSPPQRIAKRGLDLIAGAALALLALPVVGLAAALLKLTTGGPVLVGERFLGPRGDPIVVRRLQTRRPRDTEVARQIARVCNRTGIDKLPQLADVLAGSMTLVGPRPSRRGSGQATPVDVNAGMIGLRHVESHAYPELGANRRTDEFYIENWSIGLDLSIIATCVSDLLWRTVLRTVRARPRGTATI